jgi:arylsulfatase A-like enzyme
MQMRMQMRMQMSKSVITRRSFLRQMGQAQAPETRHLFFSHYWIEKNSGHTQAAVLHGDWKLVQNTPGEPLELYHLKDDPQEKTNLAGASPRPAQYDELKLNSTSTSSLPRP